MFSIKPNIFYFELYNHLTVDIHSETINNVVYKDFVVIEWVLNGKRGEKRKRETRRYKNKLSLNSQKVFSWLC